MLHALKWTHSKGIIHADIKPENIMYNDETHNIELIDYGSAKIYTEGSPYKFQYNSDVVTVTYRAPELFSSNPYYSSSLTPKVDIWSVGIILLQMLTPKHQFNTEEDDSPFAITKERIDKYFNLEKTKRPKHTETEAWHKIYNKIVEKSISDLFIKEQRVKVGPNKYIIKQFISEQKIENYLLRYATIPKQTLMKNKILLNLLMQMLSLDPSQRIDSSSALRHAWFNDVNIQPPSINRCDLNKSNMKTYNFK